MYSTIEDATAIAKPQCAQSRQSSAYLAVRVVQGTVVTLGVQSPGPIHPFRV